MNHVLYTNANAPSLWVILLSLAVGWFTVHTQANAQEGPVSEEPPLVNRPTNFQGAVGNFRITMRAEPTELQAEDPLLLTVRITGTGNLQELKRPDLRRLPKFTDKFHVENDTDRYLPREQAREFVYRLKPLTASVKEIPPLPFVYFKPGMIPPHKGYQTALAKAIPLRVKPRAEVQPSQVQGARAIIDVPDALYQLSEGASVLRRQERFVLPSPLVLVFLFLTPPSLCVLWYAAWRRRYPDAARLANQRRSRAARQGLKALRSLRTSDDRERTLEVGAILVEYLRKRLDLVVGEPTPAEVAAHLQRMGSSPTLAQEVARFFASCDATRFAPGFPDGQENWTETAARLLLALEDEPWPSLAA
jgi:hypothetical protein